MAWMSHMGRALGSLAVCLLLIGGVAYAEQSSSTNYKVEETFFGTGGELESSSSNYKAQLSAGETTVGNSGSASYQFQGGFNTSDVPLLEFAVNGGVYDLGLLSINSTAAVTPTFTVRNYLSSGYIVTMSGSAPSNGGGAHTLTPLSAQTASQTGVEQFGVNLVDNSTPNVGTDPVQVPDVSYSFGMAATGYNSANVYKFASGDIIALSPKSSGQTNYAMSIIANIATSTPSGEYGGVLTLQVIPTF